MSAVDDIAAYLAYLKTGGNSIDQIIFDELPNGEEMNATDELRRLLDERGVEWWQSANTLGCIFTRWHSPLFGDEVVAMENGEEGLVLFDHFMTPEQAIEATLGGVPYSKPTVLSDLQAENEKLRELVRKVEHYERFGCRGCPHSGSCGAGTLYDEDCAMSLEIERVKRELGVEV